MLLSKWHRCMGLMVKQVQSHEALCTLAFSWFRVSHETVRLEVSRVKLVPDVEFCGCQLERNFTRIGSCLSSVSMEIWQVFGINKLEKVVPKLNFNALTSPQTTWESYSTYLNFLGLKKRTPTNQQSQIKSQLFCSPELWAYVSIEKETMGLSCHFIVSYDQLIMDLQTTKVTRVNSYLLDSLKFYFGYNIIGC